MDYEVIDNFLSYAEFEEIKSEFTNSDIQWYYNDFVSSSDEKTKDEHWNWYFTHTIYNFDAPQSSKYPILNKVFRNKFIQRFAFKSWIRMKASWYPFTSELQEHQQHCDYNFDHKTAVFGLNTCNGFTRMSNGDKIESVENRLIIFNGSKNHNSTTTSNSKYRMNININWL
jgi:hypothetical protein